MTDVMFAAASAERLQICDHGIATVPQPGIHHGAAVVD